MFPVHLKKERLADAIPGAVARLASCCLCPRTCNVDRTRGEAGVCNTLDKAVVCGVMPHHGEEPPLSGSSGSGTIFFSHCNLRCRFCQNDDISLHGRGEPAEPEQIARAMMQLQDQGCHNINFVTPSHVVPFMLQATDLALDMGLELPIVYNSSGYDAPETLHLLDGIVDIYMPDFKFWDPDTANRLCNAPDYPQAAREALRIMHRQVGDLRLDENGIARNGLLVRHLVMPEDLAGTEQVMAFLAKEISARTHVNIMSQYHPVGQARDIPEISRPVTVEEFKKAVALARQYGLKLVR